MKVSLSYFFDLLIIANKTNNNNNVWYKKTKNVGTHQRDETIDLVGNAATDILSPEKTRETEIGELGPKLRANREGASLPGQVYVM